MLRTLFVLLFLTFSLAGEVIPGIENLLTPKYSKQLAGKRIGLITNQTGLTRNRTPTLDYLQSHSNTYGYTITALFAPEHGFHGSNHSWERTHDSTHRDKTPIYSLHGKTMRPTAEMLKDVDLLIFDIQDIGSRSYTYSTTLFYVMEEAAKYKIPVIVADRPNPINGIVVDGPMLDSNLRSIVGYIDVPYCHGLTIGELAHYFNEEYKVGCNLHVIPMQGWRRTMTFTDTGLPWVPTSPNIPEPTTPYYYPMTGILGELQMVNIGIGFTLPFKTVGAPWIDGQLFAEQLNNQKLPGVVFHPFHYKPFYGRFANETVQGVFIDVTNHKTFKPVATQYVIIGILKSLYPRDFEAALHKAKDREAMFAKVNGSEMIMKILKEKPYVAWELREFDKEKRQAFMNKRKHYLNKAYALQ